MRKKQVWRYYCDHCRKGRFTESSMRLHEEHCTLNPARKCRMCNYGDGAGITVAELIKLLPIVPNPLSDGTNCTMLYAATAAAMPKLREAAGNCPACIMAALRQAGGLDFSDFDFKAECKDFWVAVNDAVSVAAYGD